LKFIAACPIPSPHLIATRPIVPRFYFSSPSPLPSAPSHHFDNICPPGDLEKERERMSLSSSLNTPQFLNDVDVIICLSDSDDDDVDVSGVGGKDATRKVSLDPSEGGGGVLKSSASLLDDEDDDEVEVMDGELYHSQQLQAAASASASATGNAASSSAGISSSAAAAKATTTDNNDEEELEIVGTHNEQRLPHNRQNCLDNRFCASTDTNSDTSANDNNSNFCSLCYCYVCDKPASECNNWINGTKGVCSDIAAAAADGGGKKGSSANTNSTNATNQQPHMNHCNATDKGSQSTLWKNMRNAIKKGKDPSKVSASHDESYNPHAPNASLQRYLQNYGVYMPSGGGPLHRSDQHYQVRATNRAAASQHTMNPYAAAMLASATSANQAMLMAAMNHALSRGPPPLGTTVPPARSSGSRRGRRTYTIRSGSAAAAAMSAAVAAAIASGSSAASSARTSSRGRSRSRATPSAAATIAAAAAASTASSRRRNRPESNEDNSGNKRPAPHDHQARMRTQQMLEDLYG
jgi:hypothetical protein